MSVYGVFGFFFSFAFLFNLSCFDLPLPSTDFPRILTIQVFSELLQIMPSPTIDLYPRDGSSSSSSVSLSSSSLSCTGKNADLSRCEKPTSSNALEIGLGVAIPVFVILVILSYFIIRNYRKEKREAMDHDPDFDENGDPTALPDLPAFAKESNPFRPAQNQVAANGGYPLMLMQNKSVQDVGSIDKRSLPAESFVDGFVLPYHNQTGSKASLDHFARQLGDHNSFNHHRRVSDYSSSSINIQKTANHSERSSPLRSNLNTSSSQLNSLSQHGSPQRKKMTGVLNDMYDSHNHRSNTLVNINISTSDVEAPLTNPYRVKYENEPDTDLSSPVSGPTKMDVASAKAYSATTEAADLSSEIVSIHDSEYDSEDEHYRMAHSSPSKSMQSASAKTIDDINAADESHMTTADVSSPFDEKVSNSLQQLTDLSDPEKPHDESLSDTSINVTRDSQSGRSLQKKDPKPPRMSAFNMLQNVSDDEDEEGGAKKDPPQMTEEQEIELARMKSVYNVYFDRTNSVKSVGDVAAAPDATFHADSTQPLPNLDSQRFKVNSNLTTDTDYDKRKTTTSSIYDIPAATSHQDRHEEYPEHSQKANAPVATREYDQSQQIYSHNEEKSHPGQEAYSESYLQGQQGYQDQDYAHDQENYPQQYNQQYQGQYANNGYYGNYDNSLYSAQQYLPQGLHFYANDANYDHDYNNQYPLQQQPQRQQQSYPLQESQSQRYYNTASSRLPNALDIRKSSLQTYTNFVPKQRVSSSPNVKQQEFYSGSSDPVDAQPAPYNLLSASLMTTGAPITLQRRYKPAGAF